MLEIIRSSARHGQAVSRSLRVGVIESVQHLLGGLNKCGKHDLSRLFDESLTVVYRVLFLMFAESRSLVPNWHPIYRESYTVESLRERAERPGKVPGLWEALQAIARLAHKGCRAGSLVVPPFNGRLFSPARSPIAESCAVDDEVARQGAARVVDGESGPTPKLTRRRSSAYVRHARRTRIDYRDLGVEQLGAVYESVLDYEPAYADSKRDQMLLRRGGDARKSTGSFYTPQTLTDYVVRRTLHPLVDGAPADRILQLRVVDPAMGSAAFLVSACRYLARAYERALVRDGLGRRSRHRRSGPRAVQAARRAAMPLRCRFESDGGAARAPVAVARHTVGQQAADVSRSPPCLRQQPHRRVAHRHRETAAGRRDSRRPPNRSRHAALLRRRPRAVARARRRRATLAGRHSG